MQELSKQLTERFPFISERPSADHPAINCPQDHLLELLRALRDEDGYQMLMDVTAIDHYEASPRFEVIYHLFHLERGGYLRIATPCEGDSNPVCQSVVELWPAANWHERETFDMFGISFRGHPDLRRILMWDEYPFFPLRKEFPLAGEEVELPAPDFVEQTGVRMEKAPMMGGPFHSGQTGAMSKREPRADDESWTEVKKRGPETEGVDDKPREFRPTRS